MAVYNAIQEKSLNRVLQQRLTMVGEAPAPALVPELQASLVLESDRPEWRRWKPEWGFSAYVRVAAVAAEFSGMWIQAAAGRVLVLTEIALHTAFAVNFGLRTTQPTYTAAAIANAYALDNSFGSIPLNVITNGTSAVLPQFDNANAAVLGRLSTQRPIFNQPIVLWPGTPGIMIRDAAANQTLEITVAGYTRPLLPNELG